VGHAGRAWAWPLRHPLRVGGRGRLRHGGVVRGAGLVRRTRGHDGRELRRQRPVGAGDPRPPAPRGHGRRGGRKQLLQALDAPQRDAGAALRHLRHPHGLHAGLGRIVALYCCPSTLYKIRYSCNIFGPSFSETTMRPNPPRPATPPKHAPTPRCAPSSSTPAPTA
jgi:hypothetical protein